jgi:hypothetical protein
MMKGDQFLVCHYRFIVDRKYARTIQRIRRVIRKEFTEIQDIQCPSHIRRRCFRVHEAHTETPRGNKGWRVVRKGVEVGGRSAGIITKTSASYKVFAL